MEQILLILLIVVIAGLGLVVFLIMSRKSEKTDDSAGFQMLMNQMNELTKTVDTKLGEGTRQMHETVRSQFGDSQKLIQEITKEITEVKEVGKQTAGFAEQLKSLQDILKNPKQRGVLGEYYLETLLKNVLSPSDYQMQYAFSNGEAVDAVVFVKEKIIPIDSKFSLENYNRIVEEKDEAEKRRLEKVFENDLKNRIQETAKYIRPQEGTMEFAFMFIPHEAIYYDLLVGKVGLVDEENLIQRAASKYKVIIVSPTSFLAYLQTVLQGLKALQIEEQAKDIIVQVGRLGKHLKTYEEYHSKLGNNLSTVVNQYNTSSKEFKKIDKDVLKITGDSADLEVLEIDKPEQD